MDPEAVERRWAVEEDRMLLDALFERVPHFGLLQLDHSLAALIVPTRPFCSSRF